MTWPPAATLRGAHVRLEPLSQSHATPLAEAARSLGPLWYTSIPAPEEMEAEIEARLSARGMQPFAVLDGEGIAIGMTTYLNTDEANRRVEIGATWLSPRAQRSFVNTEAKFLLLEHAFERLECIAVEFRTHRLNTQSRTAIERLGAQLDGILRAHMILPDGTIRDTACYSITAPEWPAVRANLSAKLGQ